jgi:hypothetical protein
MNLKITISVKFRVAGITLGKVGPLTFHFPVPPEAIVFAGLLRDGLKFDQRGVSLAAALEAAS